MSFENDQSIFVFHKSTNSFFVKIVEFRIFYKIQHDRMIIWYEIVIENQKTFFEFFLNVLNTMIMKKNYKIWQKQKQKK